jgi:hypothetical protein
MAKQSAFLKDNSMKILAFLAALLFGGASPALATSPTIFQDLQAATFTLPGCNGMAQGNGASPVSCLALGLNVASALQQQAGSASGFALFTELGPWAASALPIFNNPSMGFTQGVSSLAVSGTAGTTCGGSSSFGFPCAQLYSITGDTVNSSAQGALDGWQFNYKVGAGVKGARQGLDIIMDFTAPSDAANTNRNYVPLTTYMQIDSGDGGGVGTEKGSFFGSNFVVRGSANNLQSVVGTENDINVSG